MAAAVGANQKSGAVLLYLPPKERRPGHRHRLGCGRSRSNRQLEAFSFRADPVTVGQPPDLRTLAADDAEADGAGAVRIVAQLVLDRKLGRIRFETNPAFPFQG